MASQITCITKPNVHSDHEAITHVGGYRASGARFYITRLECANDIDNFRDQYYVQVGNDRANVTTYVKNGTKYIKTKPDWTLKDNLLSLNQC